MQYLFPLIYVQVKIVTLINENNEGSDYKFREVSILVHPSTLSFLSLSSQSLPFVDSDTLSLSSHSLPFVDSDTLSLSSHSLPFVDSDTLSLSSHSLLFSSSTSYSRFYKSLSPCSFLKNFSMLNIEEAIFKKLNHLTKGSGELNSFNNANLFCTRIEFRT